MIRYFVLLGLTLVTISLFGQIKKATKVDSLVNFALAISEEALFDANFEAAKNAIDSTYFENIPSYTSQHRVSLELQDIRINRFRNIIYSLKTDHQAKFSRLRRLLPLANEIDNKNTLGRLYLSLSNAYQTNGQTDSSKIFLNLAIKTYTEQENHKEIANINASIISRYHNQLLQQGKKEEILKLIPKYEQEIAFSKKHNKYAMSYNTRHLAQIHRRQTQNYQKALELFKTSLDLRLEIGFMLFIPASYSSLGDVYMKMKKFSEAIEMYTKSSRLAEKIGFVRYQVYPNLQIGKHYNNLGKPEKALDYYRKALDLATNSNYLTGVDQAKEHIRDLNQKK